MDKKIEEIQQIIQVEVINNIKKQVDLFQYKTGISKTYIAKRLGISKQALSETFKSENPRIETLIKIALCLNCKVEDLYEYKYNSEKNEL